LRRSAGYIATEVTCESVEDGRFRVRDFWKRHREFEVFREGCAEGFAEFERLVVDELIEKQQFVGAYYEAGGEDVA
jgi:hypothetical protein